jgi:hypothetical protein
MKSSTKELATNFSILHILHTPSTRGSLEVSGSPPTPLILTNFNPCSADIEHIDGKTKLNVKWRRHRNKHQHQTQPSSRIFPLMTEVKNVSSDSKQNYRHNLNFTKITSKFNVIFNRKVR